MQLDAVKTGADGVAGRLTELAHHRIDIGLGHGARSDGLDKARRLAAVIDEHLDAHCGEG